MDFVPGRNFALIKEQERMVHNPRKSMTADTFEKKNFCRCHPPPCCRC